MFNAKSNSYTHYHVRTMIAKAAWIDKNRRKVFGWSDTNLQQLRGYIRCLADNSLITPVAAINYETKIIHLISKINKLEA